jgi:hypothetical protein
MALFADREEVYRVLGGFFEALTTLPQAALIHKVGGVVRFQFHHPDATLSWVPEDPAVTGRDFHVVLGDDGPPPLLAFDQDADLANRFWQGRLDLAQALSRQQIRATGPLSRAMKLLPSLDEIYPLYPDHLVRLGRADLVMGP